MSAPPWMGMPPAGGPYGGPPVQVHPTAVQYPPAPPQPPKPPPSQPEMQQWTEHKSPDGRPYWYNKVTKQSVWEKPASLKTHAEILKSTCPWKEYTNADTGRKYYFNSQTKKSVWVKPKELEEIDALVSGKRAEPVPNKQAAPTSTPSVQISEPSSQPVPAAAIVSEQALPVASASVDERKEAAGKTYATKEEAKAVFMQLLRDKNVQPIWNWDKTRRVIGKDERYEALKKEGERKQVFNAWKPIRTRELQDEERAKLKMNRTKLQELMVLVDEVSPDTSYRQAAELLRTHEYFKNVRNDRDRQDIFNDVIRQKARDAKESEKKQRRQIEAAVTDILKNHLSDVTQLTPFADALVAVKESEHFKTNPLLENCHDLHIFDAFTEYVKTLEKEYELQVRKENESKRRGLRHAREAFEALLEKLHKENKLTVDSKWKEHYSTIAADDAYEGLLQYCGKDMKVPEITPLDFFKLKIDDLKQAALEEKKTLKSIMREAKYEVTPSTTLKEFHDALCSDARYVKISSDTIRAAVAGFVADAEKRAAERAVDDARRKKRRAKRFLEMLQYDVRKISEGQTWEDVSAIFEKKQDYLDVEDDAERARLYAEFVATDPWKKRSNRSHSPESDGERRDRDRHRHKKRRKEKKDKKDRKDKKKSSHKRRKRDEGRSDDDGASSAEEDPSSADADVLEQKRREILEQLQK
eukprot:m.627413 g.627413  ORF g.627413 m.627413 type:complete len:697 (-) comp22557_c0_seq1:230-2320(-)